MPQPLTADFDRLVDDLANRRPIRQARLAMLSELDASARRELGARWSEIPADVRETLIADTAALAETQLDLDFDELGRAALRDSEPEIRVKAIETLWESLKANVGDDLILALATDTEEAVRAAAAATLAPFVLARQFDDVDANLGDRVVEALRATVEDAEEPVNVRGAALEAVAGRALPWVATLINDAYYDDDREMRLSALRAMGYSAHDRWLEVLAEDLQSSDADVRLEAVTAVGEIGQEDGVDMIAPLLDDEDRDVVLAMLEALANIAGEGAMEALREFTRLTRDPELRDAARAAQDLAIILTGEDDEEDQREADPWDEVNTGRNRLLIKDAVSAGGVVWRRGGNGLEVVLCGRSDGLRVFPKGTPDAGESIEETALREVREETGLDVALGEPLGVIEYWFTSGGIRYHKQVHHWLMEPTGGSVDAHDHEFEIVEWLDLGEAYRALSYVNERKVLVAAAAKLGATL